VESGSQGAQRIETLGEAGDCVTGLQQRKKKSNVSCWPARLNESGSFAFGRDPRPSIAIEGRRARLGDFLGGCPQKKPDKGAPASQPALGDCAGAAKGTAGTKLSGFSYNEKEKTQ